MNFQMMIIYVQGRVLPSWSSSLICKKGRIYLWTQKWKCFLSKISESKIRSELYAKKSRLCRKIRNKQRIPFLPLSVNTCAQHRLCFCWVSVTGKFFRPHRCSYERSLAFSWILAGEGIATVGRMWEKMSNCMPISFLRPQIFGPISRSPADRGKVLFLLNKFPLPPSLFEKKKLYFWIHRPRVWLATCSTLLQAIHAKCKRINRNLHWKMKIQNGMHLIVHTTFHVHSST